MASSSSSSSSSSTVSKKYHDVFISFRGDTRYNFTSHLHTALLSKKIITFIDDDLERGDEISPALLNVIEESRIAVIVFSKRYATSEWCLEELAKIIECKKARDLMVLPVFYHVDPSHVRNQTGPYGEAFVKHEKMQSSEKVMRWRNALKEAANITGFDSSYIRHEAMLVKEVVEEILEKLNRMSPSENNEVVEEILEKLNRMSQSENNDLLEIRENLELLLLQSIENPELPLHNLVGIQSIIKELLHNLVELQSIIKNLELNRLDEIRGTGRTGRTPTRIMFTIYLQIKVREELEKIGLIRLRQDHHAAILKVLYAILKSAFIKSRIRSKYGEIQEVCKGALSGSECSSLMSDHVMQLCISIHWWAETESQYLTFDFSEEYYNVVKCGVELDFTEDCTDDQVEQVKQYKGDFSSNMEEEAQPKRLKL